MAAFDEGDMDAVMSDYATDAVLLTPEGPKYGHGEIRPALEWFLKNILATATDFTMIQQTVEGEVAYIAWSAESPRYRIPSSTDTFIVRNGKIVVQTMAAKVEEKA